ncbi:MAG: hypothetical protein ABSH51_10910 [Solirubrobacteraceae bacterium]|jgi:hypothetical protein
MVKRESWLSVTPEPERELPEAVATLRAGGPPPAGTIDAERARIERLVLTGSQRRWLGYLHEVVELIGRDPEAGGDGFDTLSRARGRAIAVIANHHNLLLALPGPGAGLTASDRARLDALTGPRPLQGAR